MHIFRFFARPGPSYGFLERDYSVNELSPKILEHLMDFGRIDRHDPSLDLRTVFF